MTKKKEPYKNLPNLKEAKPLGNGGIPISRTEESAPGSNRLSTPNGLNASESKDSKSSSNLQTNEEKNDLFRLPKTFKDGQRIEIVKADWTKGKTTEQVASERKTRRAVERVNETAERLGLDVEIKTDTEGLEGQQKNLSFSVICT